MSVTVTSTKRLTQLRAADAEIDGNIVVGGTVDGIDIATRDALLTTTNAWGDHGLSAQDKTDIGNLSGTNTGDQTLPTLNSLGAAPLASPTLTGTPLAPTATANTNTTQIATTAYVQTELTDLIGGAPGTLDTLNELAAAIDDDASYASTLTTALSTKLPLAGGTMTGGITGPNNFDIISGYSNRGRITLLTTNTADSSAQIRLLTDGGTRLTVTKVGNVGIGTTTPGQVLDVVGNIAVSGTVDGIDIATDVAANTLKTSNIVQTTVTGNAGTVTNGVYTTGDQTIGGNKTFSNNLTVNGTTVLDGLQMAASDDYITFYGGNSTQHSISARGLTGAGTDDLRFNTYGSFIINLDSNNNQTSEVGSSFYIGRHAGAASTMSDILFKIDGSNGDVDINGNVDISGNLVIGGTVDGIDIATDVAANTAKISYNSAASTKLGTIETSATADQTAAQLRTAIGTGNGNLVPATGTSGHFLKHDGSFGLPSYTTNTNTTYSVQDGELSQNNFTNADHTKLNGIETSATADQSNAEIRTAVEAATDSNVFTDADHTKLNGIETSATADQTAAQIRTAIGTGNGNLVPATGTSGHFLKHDGSFGIPAYSTANTDTNVDVSTLETRLGQINSSITIGNGASVATTAAGALTATGLLTAPTSKIGWRNLDWAGSSADIAAAQGDVIYHQSSIATTEGAIYQMQSNGNVALADADAVNTSTTLLMVALSNNANKGLLLRGMVALSATPNANPGAPIYLSTTAGQAQNAAPSQTGDVVRILGYQLTNTEESNAVYFNPDNTWVELT